jgi:hypothetical protein
MPPVVSLHMGFCVRLPGFPTVLLSPLVSLHVRDTALALLGAYFPLVCCFLLLSPFISLSCRFMHFLSLVCCVRLPGV